MKLMTNIRNLVEIFPIDHHQMKSVIPIERLNERLHHQNLLDVMNQIQIEIVRIIRHHIHNAIRPTTMIIRKRKNEKINRTITNAMIIIIVQQKNIDDQVHRRIIRHRVVVEIHQNIDDVHRHRLDQHVRVKIHRLPIEMKIPVEKSAKELWDQN